MRSIKYLGRYDIEEYKNERRNYFISAKTKMDYISGALNDIGYKVEIISPAWTDNSKGYYRSRKHLLKDDISLLVGPSFGVKTSAFKIIPKIFSWIWLVLFLIFRTKKNEEIIVYHSMNLIIPLTIVKIIKQIRIVLEVEEIYTNIGKYNNVKKRLELQFFKNVDKYIFANEKLNELINIDNKPYCVLYGMYYTEEKYNERFADEKVHIVYAGIINEKKGSMISVDIALNLDENYHVHIIGYGDSNSIESLRRKIDHVKKSTKCEITFDGLYTGIDYVKYIQKCDIGLCPQIDDSKYNSSSFPSKISSYLSNGLRVVSIDTEVIRKSPFGNVLFLYEKQHAQDIANLIKAIDLKESYNCVELMEDLSVNFKKCLNDVLNKL